MPRNQTCCGLPDLAAFSEPEGNLPPMDKLGTGTIAKVRKYPFFHSRLSECATPFQSNQPRKGDKPPVSLYNYVNGGTPCN